VEPLCFPHGRQIILDCSFLESLQILDYSLLLGLHFRAPDPLTDILEPPNEMSDQESDSVGSVDGRPLNPFSDYISFQFRENSRSLA
jgi:hypothetical protein